MNTCYSIGRSHSTSGAESINLSSVDLNLLVTLDALLEHCNVTRAADKVGLSQPAMSRALSRLRGMFNDDLLVRTSAGYVRTIRGEQLHDRLPITLDAVRELVSSRMMRAEQWQTTIRLAMPDHQSIVLLPQVLDRLSGGSMTTRIATEPLTPHMLKRLENGDLEMAIGHVSGSATGFFQRKLYVDDYACLLRRDHPALQGDWSAERFHDLQHAIPASGHEGEWSHVTDALMHLPVREHSVMLPNTMGAAMAIVESDMVLTLPRRAAKKIAALLPLEVIDAPIDIAPVEVMLLWHERSHRNTEHEWVRSQIAAASHATTPKAPLVDVPKAG